MTLRMASPRSAALLVALTFGTGLQACFESTTADKVQTQDLSPTLTRLADSVLVPTYVDLAQRASTMASLAEALNQDVTQARLDTLATAWRSAREPWEQSEAFLFGPVAYQNLDPSLDSWPVDRGQLDKVLASGQELSPEFISDGLGYVLKGFHTAEYLIFRDGVVRKAADLTPREREYLLSVLQVLAQDAQSLADAWTGDKGFAQEYVRAGQAGSRYASSQDAIQETWEKCVEILDEVGHGKIADPYTSKDPNKVESQFAYNSLRDFADNLRSVRNVWTGSLGGSKIQGLGSLAEAGQAGLGASVLQDIDNSLAAIQAIPEPFSSHLNSTAQIDAALASLEALQKRFETEVAASLKL